MWWWLHRLLEPLSPHACAACGGRLSEGGVLCEACAPAAEPWPDRVCPGCGRVPSRARGLCRICRSLPEPPPGRLHLSWVYGGAVAQAVRSGKLAPGAVDRAALLGALAACAPPAPDLLDGLDAVIAVPPSPGRLARVGHDAATEMGAVLARGLGLPLLQGLLRRSRAPSQTTASARDRRRRVEGLYSLCRRARSLAGGRRLLLVDDVRTTGATLAVTSGLLRKAGAEEVRAWVLSGHLAASEPAPPLSNRSRRSGDPSPCPGPWRPPSRGA